MEWTSSEENGILKIALDGRLVAACVDDMQEALLPQVERTPNVVLDLTKMVHIDSSGLGLLVHLLQKANEKGGTVKIACLQPHPRVVFDITKVYRVFKIYDTVEEAMSSFSA
jgi:anti-sigma B factor antagonist